MKSSRLFDRLGRLARAVRTRVTQGGPLQTTLWGLGGLLLLTLLGVAVMVLVYGSQLPSLDRVTDYQPRQPLQVFTRDGVEIAQFGTERRIFIPIQDMPQRMQDALLAIEDSRFREHSGIDFLGVARAMVANLGGGRAQGASTITQQVARNFFLSSRRTLERKIKEALLALEMERVLSKDQILELYMNQIYLGHRAYGFGAAAQTYFGKPLAELTIAECAMLAGLPQNPAYANPQTNLARAVARQHLVLGRMLDTGVISQAEHDAAMAQKLVIQSRTVVEVHADYVAEMARRAVVDQFGDQAYSKGIKVYTSLLAQDQEAAWQSLRKGLLDQDRRQAWRGPEDHEELPSADDEVAITAALKDHPDDETLRVAVVLKASPRDVQARLASGESVSLQGEGLRWAQPALSPKASEELRLDRGAIIRVMQDDKGRWAISQFPEAQAAFVSLDPGTGRVRAMVGGFDFTRQPFNHATQAWRQPGSSFKPFLFSAALEHGVMPATMISDAPLTIGDWSPQDAEAEGGVPMTMRQALAESRNLVSIRLLQLMGLRDARQWLTRFGFDLDRQPDNLTLALGAGSTTPLQQATAYAVFANGGHKVSPVVIERIVDAAGQTVFEAPPPPLLREVPLPAPPGAVPAQAPPSPADAASGPSAAASAPFFQNTLVVPGDQAVDGDRVLSQRNVFMVTSLLQEVTRTGTAARAQAELRRPDIYGKTGTTNDVFDAWFAGFQPSVVAVAWMGYDQPRSLGSRQSGAGLSLPIWIGYMNKVLKNVPVQPLEAPAGVLKVDGDWVYSEFADGSFVHGVDLEEPALAASAPASAASGPGAAAWPPFMPLPGASAAH
jgi:penicillin-binding protein 1A